VIFFLKYSREKKWFHYESYIQVFSAISYFAITINRGGNEENGRE
jgi:hypothetical protein